MKKVIILRKILVTIKSFAPPFQFEPEQEKCVAMRAMRKKLNIFTLLLPSYYILE